MEQAKQWKKSKKIWIKLEIQKKDKIMKYGWLDYVWL